jgi:hypothetical protein
MGPYRSAALGPPGGKTVAAHRTRVQAREEMNDEIAAAYQQLQEDKQQARRQADARANADKARAEQTAETRSAQAEQAQQAEQDRISAEQHQVMAAARQQLWMRPESTPRPPIAARKPAASTSSPHTSEKDENAPPANRSEGAIRSSPRHVRKIAANQIGLICVRRLPSAQLP